MNYSYKKIAFWILPCLAISLFTIAAPARAYEPTANDITVTWTLTNRLLDALEKQNWSNEDFKKIEERLTQLTSNTSPSIAYILTTTRDYLTNLRLELKEGSYFRNLQRFIDTYWKNIQTAWDSPNLSACFKQYAIVDDYARQISVPPAFILATWYIESSCRMENPSNRDGLFQIINNDYEPGPITVADLASQLRDFWAFLQRKRQRYNSKQPAPIQISHNDFNMNTLQSFGALYNGLAGPLAAYPLGMGNPYYFYGNYNEDFISKRDGWVVTFMKILKLEATKFGK
jgi:hypothetical protein